MHCILSIPNFKTCRHRHMTKGTKRTGWNQRAQLGNKRAVPRKTPSSIKGVWSSGAGKRKQGKKTGQPTRTEKKLQGTRNDRTGTTGPTHSQTTPRAKATTGRQDRAKKKGPGQGHNKQTQSKHVQGRGHSEYRPELHAQVVLEAKANHWGERSTSHTAPQSSRENGHDHRGYQGSNQRQ